MDKKTEKQLSKRNKETIEKYNPMRQQSRIGEQKTWQKHEEEIKTIIKITVEKNPNILPTTYLTALLGLTIWGEKENLGLTVKELLTPNISTHIRQPCTRPKEPEDIN